MAHLSTFKDGIKEIKGQFVICWTKEQVELAKKRGYEMFNKLQQIQLAAAKEQK